MKAVLTLAYLFLFGFSNLVIAKIQQVPTSVMVNQNNRDTLIRTTATITHYSDSLTAAILSDTTYLRNLSGDYRISDGGNRVVTISVSATKTLHINLPGQGEHELIPIIPIDFKVKDLPQVEILVFTDRLGRARVLNIIDKREPQGSSKRQIGANKLGTFKD